MPDIGNFLPSFATVARPMQPPKPPAIELTQNASAGPEGQASNTLPPIESLSPEILEAMKNWLQKQAQYFL